MPASDGQPGSDATRQAVAPAKHAPVLSAAASVGVPRYTMSFGKQSAQSVAIYATQPMTQKQIDLLIKYLEVAKEAVSPETDDADANADS